MNNSIRSFKHPFIHPYLYLSEVRKSQRQQIQKENPDIPLASDTFLLLLGDPKVFPGQKEYIILPVSSGSTPEPSPTLMAS